MQRVHFKVPSFSPFLMGAVCRYRHNSSVLHPMYINDTFFAFTDSKLQSKPAKN